MSEHQDHEVYCPASDGKTLCSHAARCHGMIQAGASRYDDALKRINDMQAELEHLRAELARKA